MKSRYIFRDPVFRVTNSFKHITGKKLYFDGEKTTNDLFRVILSMELDLPMSMGIFIEKVTYEINDTLLIKKSISTTAPFTCEIDLPSRGEEFEVSATIHWKDYLHMQERTIDHMVYLDSCRVRKTSLNAYLGGNIYTKAQR